MPLELSQASLNQLSLDGMANSVDPIKTTFDLGQTYLSQCLDMLFCFLIIQIQIGVLCRLNQFLTCLFRGPDMMSYENNYKIYFSYFSIKHML